MANGGCPVSHHGVSVAKGCSHAALGHFGRLFDELEPLYVSDETLEALGRSGGPMHETKAEGKKPGSDSSIPAAYTFLAQFVDHDITLDTTSQLNSAWVQDANALPNMRSASLDMDCVYGFGPDASPHLYENGKRLVVGNDKNALDLRRVPIADGLGRALIGDPRNDENLFVSQLQMAFHLFHNKLAATRDFVEAQRQARYHYQVIVLRDLLARVCDPDVYRFAIERIYAHRFPLVYRSDAHGKLPMPVEFSVAAYRFGHSMVRSCYQPNKANPEVELFDPKFGTLGFSAVPKALTVEWRYLLDTGKHHLGKKIDEKLANELIELPDPVVDDPNKLNKSLPFRNLVRGRSLGLPSGQEVARALHDAGYPVDPEADLKLAQIAKLPVAARKEIEGRTPLFFYLMREAGVLGKGQRLGPSGSAIVLEVLGGMLTHCGTSFLHDPSWKPLPELAGSDFELTLSDVLKYVGRY